MGGRFFVPLIVADIGAPIGCALALSDIRNTIVQSPCPIWCTTCIIRIEAIEDWTSESKSIGRIIRWASELSDLTSRIKQIRISEPIRTGVRTIELQGGRFLGTTSLILEASQRCSGCRTHQGGIPRCDLAQICIARIGCGTWRLPRFYILGAYLCAWTYQFRARKIALRLG